MQLYIQDICNIFSLSLYSILKEIHVLYRLFYFAIDFENSFNFKGARNRAKFVISVHIKRRFHFPNVYNRILFIIFQTIDLYASLHLRFIEYGRLKYSLHTFIIKSGHSIKRLRLLQIS